MELAALHLEAFLLTSTSRITLVDTRTVLTQYGPAALYRPE